MNAVILLQSPKPAVNFPPSARPIASFSFVPFKDVCLQSRISAELETWWSVKGSFLNTNVEQFLIVPSSRQKWNEQLIVLG